MQTEDKLANFYNTKTVRGKCKTFSNVPQRTDQNEMNIPLELTRLPSAIKERRPTFSGKTSFSVYQTDLSSIQKKDIKIESMDSILVNEQSWFKVYWASGQFHQVDPWKSKK